MSTFKEKNKNTKKKKKNEKTTLDYRHNEIVSNFNSDEQRIPQLEKKIKDIDINLNKLLKKKK